MKPRMTRSLLAVVLSLSVFAGALVTVSGPVHADSSIDQKREDIKKRDRQIQALEKQKKQNEQQRAEVIRRMETIGRKLEELDQKIYGLQEKVIAGKQEVQELSKSLEDRQRRFRERMKHIYVKGEMYHLQMLLEAETFSDFLTRFGLVLDLVRADRKNIAEISAAKEELQSAQNVLEKDLAELQKQKEQSAALYGDLLAERKKHEQVIAAIEKEQGHLEQENEEAKKELAELVARASEEARRREQAGQITVAHTGGAFRWPVDGGVLTSKFGMRDNPVTGEHKLHKGIDIGAPMGTPIRAAASGEVLESRTSSGYGWIIILYHGNGLSTLYAHMYSNTVRVEKGQKVQAGQIIAEVGSNGNSTGPHLHFEVHKDGNPVDPMPYFR
ncbi:murein hydrolase activator EnvC family protein [Staphylospora marina]|uniref:murein hydrolase activator EnvC family protein n=1 Tax=Staphylospora marina TaxID=2490858 RepID=UPI0019D182A1|nr:peptidoglycan DD-metalloendopeptidase family protein [Staphylospora marina]